MSEKFSSCPMTKWKETKHTGENDRPEGHEWERIKKEAFVDKVK